MPHRAEVSANEAHFEIQIQTGDLRGAGTDCKLFMRLYDDRNRSTGDMRLGNRFTTNCRGQLSKFYVKTNIGDATKIQTIEFYLEKFGLGELWFVEWIKVIPMATGGEESFFPIHRWVGAHGERTVIAPFDSCLPQMAPTETIPFRNKELLRKRTEYQFDQKADGGPAQVKRLPEHPTFFDMCLSNKNRFN